LLRVASVPVFIASVLKTGLSLLPLSVCLAIVGVYFFLMRHPCTPWLCIPLVVLISGLGWLVFVPFSYFMNDRLSFDYGSDLAAVSQTSGLLSPMIIRPYPTDVRAFWLGSDQDVIRSVVIASSQVSPDARALNVYPSARYDRNSGQLMADNRPVLVDVSGPDRQLRARLNRPRFLTHVVVDIQALLTHFRSAWDSSLSVYLVQVGSFAFALLGLWFCCTVTGWKMLNLVLSLVMLRLLFGLYSLIGVNGLAGHDIAFLPERLQGEAMLPVILIGIGLLFCLARLLLLVVRRKPSVSAGGLHD